MSTNSTRRCWDELETIQLMAGPDKLELLAALAFPYPDSCTGREPLKVRFDTGDGQSFLTTIRGLGHEDGSGESFVFDGTVYTPTSSSDTAIKIQQPCTGWFNTRARCGWIRVGESGETYYHKSHA